MEKKQKKGMSKEQQERRAEIEEFERKVKAGEIHSYDQFPPNTWGFGMIVGITYDQEQAILKDLKEKGEENGINEELAKAFFTKAKELILAGKEGEGLTYAYWVGKLVGRAEKRRIQSMAAHMGVGGMQHSG